MVSLDLAAAPAWLQGRRWFGSKGVPIAEIRVLDSAQLSPGLVFVTLEVRYRNGRAAERYVVALQPGGDWTEALADDAAARALLDLIRNRRTVPTAKGRLVGERFDGPGSPLDALEATPAVRRLSAEQSNTSLVFGDRVIMKLLRKLEDGANPELEMGAFLARRGFRATPELLGGLSLTGAVDATAAVVHRFVRVDSDGWTYVVEGLRRGDPGLPREIRDLGRRIGEMHVALASDSHDPTFAPEPIRAQDLERWAGALSDDLERTIAAAAEAVPELASGRTALERLLRRLTASAPAGVRIRQHGDLHLGQVLRSEGDWLVFDFEGEPARSLGERRAKHSPFKDVAGMLRSFSYAAATAKTPEAIAPAREAFLEGWRSVASRLVPDGPSAQPLLDALELEKLLYELRYELGHRPDWVAIPARDLLAAAGGA